MLSLVTVAARKGIAGFVLLLACRIAIAQQTPAAPPPDAPQPAAAPPPPKPPPTPPPFPKTVVPPSAVAPVPTSSWVVEPYGLITVNGTYLVGNSSNAPDVPQWATVGSSAFLFTARQTRLGIRGSWLTPPSKLRVQKVAGLVEADFYGGFLGPGLGYYFGVPRLRLATATVEWSSVRLSFGQDWSLLAPLNPDSALHVAVPGFTTSGNLWARMPQFRIDGVVGFGGPATKHTWRFVWAAAFVAEVQADAIPVPQNVFTNTRIVQGGWAQLSWGALTWLTLYAGGGADKPKTDDLLIANAATNRTLNAAVYAEASVEFARGFALWFEYDFMHTEYQAIPTQQTSRSRDSFRSEGRGPDST